MGLFGLVTQSELDKRLQSFATRQGLKGDRGDIGMQGPKGEKGDKGDAAVIVEVKAPAVLDLSNSNSLQAYLDSIPEYSTVYLPSGSYTLAKQIEIKKPVRIIGNWNTKLVGSIKVFPGAYCYLKDFELHSDGKSPNGIEISGISHLENIKVYRFSGDGVHVTADIHINGANASQSTFRNVEVIECQGNGFYMRGGDSNGMTFYNCSARDSGGIGFYDHSFLGNSFFGCMGHANVKGHYRSDDPNARSVFVGCYSENQGVKNAIGGAGRVLGGIHPDGWELLTQWAKVDFQ